MGHQFWGASLLYTAALIEAWNGLRNYVALLLSNHQGNFWSRASADNDITNLQFHFRIHNSKLGLNTVKKQTVNCVFFTDV